MADNTISTTLIKKFQDLAFRMGVECHDIRELITTGLQALKGEIIGEASAAYDSLKELEDFIKAHDIDLAQLQAIANGAIVYNDNQTLTDLEKSTARNNIGAGSATDVASALSDISALKTRMTNTESTILSNSTAINQAGQNIVDLGGRVDALEGLNLDTRLNSVETTIERSDLDAMADFMDEANAVNFVDIFDTALASGSKAQDQSSDTTANEAGEESGEDTTSGGGEATYGGSGETMEVEEGGF